MTTTPAQPATPRVPAVDVDRLRARVEQSFPALRATLESLVRIPSVSNASFAGADVEGSAEAIAGLLRDVGLPEVDVLRAVLPDGSSGAPAVVARRPAAPGAPTVLLYAHHDVQPPGDLTHWRTEPFEPVEVDGRLYGRGAADDKAGIVAHLGALGALVTEGLATGVGVTVFVEGEEEVGSPSFLPFLEQFRDRLRADVIVVADSSNWKVGVPGLTTSLRGLVDVEVEVAVTEHPVHSGMLGGPVLDAPTLMARLVATLHDEAGDVAVAGLTSAPDPTVDYAEADFRADAGLLDGVRLAGTGPLTARLWTRPAISLIGMDVRSVAEAFNVIAPTCRAMLSVRVAPGQDPQAAFDAVRAHLEQHAPFGARVTVTAGDLGKPFLAPTDSPAMRSARWAFEEAWGVPPVDIGLGGSIPFIADLQEVYPDAAILVTGVEDPQSLAHGANESVHLGELQRVVLAEALLIRAMSV